MAVWGFFECENDPETAVALFSAVEKWASEKGMDFLRGPMNPSLNYESGLLVQGFEFPPAMMMPYNPPYYAELVRFCGYDKEKSAFVLTAHTSAPHPSTVLMWG